MDRIWLSSDLSSVFRDSLLRTFDLLAILKLDARLNEREEFVRIKPTPRALGHLHQFEGPIVSPAVRELVSLVTRVRSFTVARWIQR